MLLIPNAAAMSEFMGYSGDCGETAELAALHVYNGLAENAVDLDTIVRREIGDHEASASGAEPLSAIAQDLVELKVPHTVQNYAQPFNVDWRSILKSQAGHNAIIIEVANAQALIGDEKGVHYHFICVLGISDNGEYIVADGDNVAARSGQLVQYSEQELAAAIPCGLIEVIMPAVTHINDYFDQDSSGAWVVRPGHPLAGKRIQGGILAAYKAWSAEGSQHGLTALGLPVEDEAAVPGHPNCWWQPFERGTVIFDRDRVIDNPPGAQGDVYVAHVTYHP